MRHPFHKERNAISLLLKGNSPTEVSEIIGIKKNTIISWRRNHKKIYGTEFPSHRGGSSRKSGYTVGKVYFKYTDDEIITLARLNPGVGVQSFVNYLYPRKKKSTHGTGVRYRITMLLIEHKENTGEDLYELLQDPSFCQMVSANEYRKITGKSRVPRRQGRSNSRTSKISVGFGKGTREVEGERNIPLPPQGFNWGDIVPAEERAPRKTTDMYSDQNIEEDIGSFQKSILDF